MSIRASENMWEGKVRSGGSCHVSVRGTSGGHQVLPEAGEGGRGTSGARQVLPQARGWREGDIRGASGAAAGKGAA